MTQRPGRGVRRSSARTKTNTGEHRAGDHVVEEHSGRSALAELRERLRDGRVLAGLSMTQLAARTGLGRTTVHAAFQADGPVPSADTVAALARALRLPAEELPALQRAAAQEAAPAAVPAAGPGRPIAKWDPHDLEVHPAGIAASSGSVVTGRVLSGYVHRAHDRVLADAVKDAEAGRNRMLVLVGSSSTGKTRACWEAVQPLANQAWRLWHPFDPTRAEAALADLARVAPRTVVWLNEAQHYLGDPQVGERIAAALHALLTDPGRGPVLILGTLWPEYEDLYTAVPRPGGPDPHSRARELLAGRTVTVPHAFNQDALDAAASSPTPVTGCWRLPSLAPAPTGASPKTSPAPPNSCAAISTAPRPSGPCWRPRWTPVVSGWAFTFPRRS